MTTPQEKPQIPENEIRVGIKTNVFHTIERIEEVFKTCDHIVISGLNDGISKVLLITEITKLKFEGLHQYNLIETITTEMKDEGKDQKDEEEHKRYMTRFKVELYKAKPSTEPKGFYQAPYSHEEFTKLAELKAQEGHDDKKGGDRPRGGFRGGRGGFRGGRGGRGQRGGRGGHDNRRGGERGRGGDHRRGGDRGAPRGRGNNRGGERNERRNERGTERGTARGTDRGTERGRAKRGVVGL